MMRIDDVDLQQLSQDVRARMPFGEPKGYLRGKATLRDAVREVLGCSDFEAEELVDTLESRGYLQFQGNPSERSEANAHWSIEPTAEL